eukprot:347131-Chlamydomonas_euryale.AAC.1
MRRLTGTCLLRRCWSGLYLALLQKPGQPPQSQATGRLILDFNQVGGQLQLFHTPGVEQPQLSSQSNSGAAVLPVQQW